MSSRKRRGEEDDSGQPEKRSRLLASSTGETSEPAPAVCEESGISLSEIAGEEVVGGTPDSSETEYVDVTGSDSDSVVLWEENQQDPQVSGAADDSAVLLISDDDVEPNDNDGTWSPSAWSSDTVSSPSWMDDYPEQWEQNQDLPILSLVNDAVALFSDYGVEDNDGFFGPITSVLIADCTLWQLDQNQQHPHVSGAAGGSVPLLASDDEEEEIYSNRTWSSGTWSIDTVSSFNSTDDYSELLEEYEQQINEMQSDNSVLSDDDEYDSLPEEDDSSEQEAPNTGNFPPNTVSCPICMDFYPRIIQSGRLMMSTLCGHVFCSRCLPVALENSGICPTCRTDLYPEDCHPIYI